MFVEKFFKRIFVSFYFDEEYKVLSEVVKNKKTLESTSKTFSEKKELESFIKDLFDQNPQTYVSTMLETLNQGIVDSCDKKRYKEKEVDISNVKILCLDDYSFFASLFDIAQLKKEYNFDIDFIYSFFAVIDFSAKERVNRFYVLILKSYLIILGYENQKPIYGDIYSLITLDEDEEDEFKEDSSDDVEDLDIIEDIGDDLDMSDDIDAIDEIEDIDSIDEVDEKSVTTNVEVSVLNFLKDALKEYYQSYSNDFIEKIILLDSAGIDEKIANVIEDELLIETKYQKIDIPKTLNRMSIESV
ncbi:MAG: hypothetical protein GXO62_04475 [Epsilonproteobacteria bacterium]|nr:hypothetical protein [Campylobacterota bacterium]